MSHQTPYAITPDDRPKETLLTTLPSPLSDPYQNNISLLPQADQLIAIDGLLSAAEHRALTPGVKPVTFEQWIDRNLGKGIGGLFMHPYNFKVWGVKTSEVSRRIVDGEFA